MDSFAITLKFTFRVISLAGNVDRFAIYPHARGSHFILCQGAGLIRADRGGRAQCFYRRQAADQGVAFDHFAHPQRQGDRNDGWQAFWDSRDGQTDCDQEHIQRIVAACPTYQEDQRTDCKRGPPQGFPQLVQAVLQRRGLLFDGLQHRGDHANLRVHACADNHALAAPITDHGAHKGGVLAVANRRFGLQADSGIFLNGDRFSCQGGFFDAQINCL